MDSRERSIRILMLPWLAHGHISPFLELAKKLTKRNFFTYLCSTPINLSSIKKKITKEDSLSIELVDLHLPTLPDLPPHYHTTNGLPTHLMPTLKNAFDNATTNFSNILGTINPDLLIYDFNQPWAADMASPLDIPAVLFLTTGAIMISFGFHLLTRHGQKYPFPEIYLRETDNLMPRHEGKIVSDGKDGDRFMGAITRSCNMILIKSFRELEGKYLDYFSSLVMKKMVPVGPLVQELSDQEDDQDLEVIQWLERKEKSSTVFVSFGSEYIMTKEEIEELAYGLELSSVNFIWVVRFTVLEEKIRDQLEALPEGFLERVGERGMVMKGWAPQARILAHGNIGGFVSHCGWSSIMESLKFGVPIVAMPMHLDQPLNSRLVVDVGVAFEVIRDKNRALKREEIAQVIRKVVVEKDGEGVRAKTLEFSENLKFKGEEEIDGVIEELLKICGEGKDQL